MIKKILSVVLALGMLLTLVSSLPVAAEDTEAVEYNGFGYNFDDGVSVLSSDNNKLNITQKTSGTNKYAELRDSSTTSSGKAPSVVKIAVPEAFQTPDYNIVTKVSFKIRATNANAAGKIVSLIMAEDDELTFSSNVTANTPNTAEFTSLPLEQDVWKEYELYYKRSPGKGSSTVSYTISVTKSATRSYFDLDDFEVTEYYMPQNLDFAEDTIDAKLGWSVTNATAEKVSDYAQITATGANAGINQSVRLKNGYKYTFTFDAKGVAGKKIYFNDNECGVLSGEWQKITSVYRADGEGEYSYADLSIAVKDAAENDVFCIGAVEMAVDNNYELADVISVSTSDTLSEGSTITLKATFKVDDDIEVIKTIVELYNDGVLDSTTEFDGKKENLEIKLPNQCVDKTITVKVMCETAKGIGVPCEVELGKGETSLSAILSSSTINEKEAQVSISLDNIRELGGSQINGVAVLMLLDDQGIIIGSKVEKFNLLAGAESKTINITANVRSDIAGNVYEENVAHIKVHLLDCGDNENATLANTTMKLFKTFEK